MTSSSTVLQIVPRAPGRHDGVTDYALTVARGLRDSYSIGTIFLAGESSPGTATKEFEILSPLKSAGSQNFPSNSFQNVILHYVNYGYHKRGVPFELLTAAKKLRGLCNGRFLAVFHELYASGPPWKSAFWLRPFQVQIARSIARCSDACIVSNETMQTQLRKLAPQIEISVHPVPSNFGEPLLSTDQLTNRSPGRWVICGGTILVERSLRSFQAMINRIPKYFSPNELFVLGGEENPATRSLIGNFSNITVEYHPNVSSSAASAILASCSFSWIDYFHRPTVSADVVLKSGAFAAACAHGVIPVFPHSMSPIERNGDPLPGPFFVDVDRSQLPTLEERANRAEELYAWYQRNASSGPLTRGIASTLGFAPVV